MYICTARCSPIAVYIYIYPPPTYYTTSSCSATDPLSCGSIPGSRSLVRDITVTPVILITTCVFNTQHSIIIIEKGSAHSWGQLELRSG